uniref:Uncharacterized protein n=1 Tax=Anguilla anguilla TaxID=7936 RepID=A0A0E9VK90_ANGAN
MRHCNCLCTLSAKR